MKNTINANELSFLLSTNKNKVSKIDANKMICYCLGTVYDEEIKNPEIEIDVFERKKNIPIRKALEDIHYNFMKRPQSRGWILNFPESKIFHGTSKPFPQKIRIPSPLRDLISNEVKKEIIKRWEEKFTPLLPVGIKVKFE